MILPKRALPSGKRCCKLNENPQLRANVVLETRADRTEKQYNDPVPFICIEDYMNPIDLFFLVLKTVDHT